MTEKDLKNKRQGVILYYFAIGVLIIASLAQIYKILFIQPTKMSFSLLLLLICIVLIFYLDGIKQVTEKSEKKALWKIVIIVIRSMSIIIGIIVIALALLDTLYLH